MPPDDATYFDGQSNRKRKVQVRLGSGLEIVEGESIAASWPYGDVRRVDSAPGVFRLSCISAAALARLEIHDDALKQSVKARCPSLESHRGQRQTLRVIVYSAAALASFAGLLIYGVPLLADRLALVIPASVERRLGEGVDRQVRFLLGDKICEAAPGKAALDRLVGQLKAAGEVTVVPEVKVIDTQIANAFALPGGKIYVSDSLLQKAWNADEIAGVIAHEMGHLQHRDGLRKLIQTGGTAFLVGILFGDVLGGGAIVIAARSVLTDSYSRDAERNADALAIATMRKLGRSPKPMGELLVRLSGSNEKDRLALFSSHPLTEERMATMANADRPVDGAPLLTDTEWFALQDICG